MVTWNKKVPMTVDADGVEVAYCEGECLSSDTKPTAYIYNGSKLLEMNTGKVYAFNADSAAWVEI